MGRLFGFVKLHFIVASCVVWAAAAPARAQVPEPIGSQNVVPADPPAHVSFVDGTAVLERDGQRDSSPANMPLLAGDRLRTENGRLEILFADNSTLHMDADTTIDFESDDLVRLLDGRIRLAIPGPDRQVSYRIDAPAASAVINQPGEYKLSILRGGEQPEIELAVLRGSADLVNDGGQTTLRAGQRAYARGDLAPSLAYAYNSASWDTFDRWSEGRRNQRLGISTQYLPSEVQPYASAFDQYGTWQYNTSYGYVWYPSVAVGWRPYYDGRWVAVRPYGWTWVGVGPWAWPTHHYGRWGFSAGAWFWIPARTWGPAWVSWGYAPGYVSWCPLGFNNRAVLTFGFSFGYDPWRAWTVLPYGRFGHGFVNVNYIGGGRVFDARTRSAFVTRYTAPTWRGYAVPRSTTPIRVAGTAHVRGPASTVYTNLAPGASRVGQTGRRVTVGPTRSQLADAPASGAASPDRTRAVPRGVPSDQTGAVRGEAQRSIRSVPSQPAPGTAMDRNQAGRRAGEPTTYGADRYVRRAPVPADRDGAVNADPRVRAVPRAYPSYGGRAPEMPRADGPGAVTIPRTAPEAARAPAPENRTYGGYAVERRAPGPDRPAGPPPESARPAPREYRANPGVERGAPSRNDGAGSAPQGGHSRGGGQQSGGRAVPRGR